MTFLQRLGYYLGGFSIGLIFLAFFLSGKKTSCDYSPNARVKKNIRLKTLQYSERASQSLLRGDIDSSFINQALKNGTVNFSRSNTKLDSCKIYVIEAKSGEKDMALTIENCDSIAKILEIDIQRP